MSQPAINAYDAVAYPGHSFSQTHPRRLGTIAHFHGMTPAPLDAMHVLELGCGCGGNLIPMAFQHPAARFVGIDLSGRAIEQAQRNAGALGLTNLDFRHLDIMDVTPELGTFDYIIAHGVYSWVPSFVRDRIMWIYGELLAPHGVAYVSYNAMPGCRLRDLARDVMLFATRDIDDPQERVRVARAALKTFAEATDPDTFQGAALRKRLEQIGEIPDDVLYHDDLNPGAQAFLIREVLAAAESHGLQFLAESSFPNQFGGARGAAQQLLAGIPAENVLEREQSLDLLIGRSFRETLLCRSDVRLKRGIESGCLAPYVLAADVRGAAVDPSRPGVERFEFSEGVRLSVDLVSCKAALHMLAEAWPAGVPYKSLVPAALERAGAAQEDDAKREAPRLDETLIAMFKAGLLEIHLEPPRVVPRPSERPEANAVARWQSMSSEAVTDMRHRTVALDSLIVRRFVTLLDGTRTPDTLLADLNRFLDEAHANGGSADLPRQATAEEVDQHLKDVARLALLVA